MYAVRFEDKIRVYDAYLYRDGLKSIPGRYYDADDKAWVLPMTAESVSTLQLLGARLDDGLEEFSTVMGTTEESIEPKIRPPIKGTLYQHQVKAYNFALRLFGIEGGSSDDV